VVLAKPLPLLAVIAVIVALLVGAAVGAAFAFITGAPKRNLRAPPPRRHIKLS
jgi:hypothetical protein